ncbi:MAG: endonuclease [Proteobacteria bacterium]|nr:MAG: endonuclease [Pseudomonadota bacterium]
MSDRAGGRTDEAPRDELVVASYNVHRCVGMDRRHSVERIAAVIAEMGADVVGLQEVDSTPHAAGGRDPLDAIARACGYAAIPGPILRRHDGHTGNGLLTRLPVRSRRSIDLSFPRREPRGALDVDLEHGGGLVRVFVTHFGLRAAERRAQWDRVMELMAPRGEALSVLIGDFNEWFAPARVLRRVHRTFGRARAVPSWPSPFPVLALDRMWVQPNAALVELVAHRSRLARRASDHLPVRGILRLPQRSHT